MEINRNTRRLNDTHNQLAAKTLAQYSTVQMASRAGKENETGCEWSKYEENARVHIVLIETYRRRKPVGRTRPMYNKL